ncbi:adenosylhomocysteinase [Selenomonadales bacterium OttesenSCG-928-I06]|nr:adenosylhomocysteinase [Selenomonadales bacterium OttesenSCG-928-I06]
MGNQGSIIRDINLKKTGMDKINWAKNFMPVLNILNTEYAESKPLKGKTVVVTIHIEAKTACFVLTLKNLGANVVLAGCNPLSTQDDVAAALVDLGVKVFAWYDCTPEEYDDFLNKALSENPDIIVDDGGDLTALLHNTRPELIKNILGGSEETTTGVMRLRILEKQGKLKFPIVAVNDAYCKYLFDNRYGTGQSTFDGLFRTTNLSIAGKTMVVAGYGWCGKGIAMRAKGLGANVVVTEIDPIKAMEAAFDGFRVMPMQEAAKIGDMFITVTGCKDVITKEHLKVMKSGAVMANAGHFDVEINKNHLKELSVSAKRVKKDIEEFTFADGKKVYLLAQGRLINLASGDGHPVEIMDLSFAMQTLTILYINEHHKELTPKVYDVASELNEKVALLKIKSMGIEIDKLTEEQYNYIYNNHE